ncbi:hypothetical protein F4814DRAFT_193436 [Daldinia grandis]|nr:hypothetical protein F4814DRAFT_193436 [Daldinia grandis]
MRKLTLFLGSLVTTLAIWLSTSPKAMYNQRYIQAPILDLMLPMLIPLSVYIDTDPNRFVYGN